MQAWRDAPEEDRELLIEYERQVCPSCGNLREVCSDPERVWYPQPSRCYATGTRQLTLRRLQRKYEKNQPTADRMHPLDSLSVWASQDDLTPDDNFV